MLIITSGMVFPQVKVVLQI